MGHIKIKRRVWIYLLFSLIAIAAWWAWNRSAGPILVLSPQVKQPTVWLAKAGAGTADKILRERAEFFDPTPLFFPTALNFGQGSLRESMKRQPGQVFGTFDAKYLSNEQTTKLGLMATVVPVVRVVDVVEFGNESPFSGIGEQGRTSMSLPQREGFLEVRGLHDGKIIMVQALVGIALTHLELAPTEFLLVVSSAGVVGEPVLATGSGREEIDAAIRTYLVKRFRLGEKLTPGIYRVLVGP